MKTRHAHCSCGQEKIMAYLMSECVQTYSENDLILANQNAIGVSRYTRRKLYDIQPTNHDITYLPEHLNTL